MPPHLKTRTLPIVQVAPLWESVSPWHGCIERVINGLTEDLVRQ